MRASKRSRTGGAPITQTWNAELLTDYLTPATDTETPPARTSTGRGILPGPPTWLLRAKVSTKQSAAKFALIVLWSHADTDGWTWLAVSALGEEMGCDKRTVRLALDLLVEGGAIRRVGQTQDGQSYAYRLYPAAIQAYLETATPNKNVPGSSETPNKNVPGEAPDNSVPGTNMSGGGGTKMSPLPLTKMYHEVLAPKVLAIKALQEDQVLPILPSVEPTEPAAPQKRQPKKPKTETPPDPRVAEVFHALEELQGYKFRGKSAIAEMVTIKRLLTDGIEPKTILDCWKAIRAQTWRTGPVTTATVEKNLGEYQTGRLNGASATNHVGAGPPARAAPTSAALESMGNLGRKLGQH